MHGTKVKPLIVADPAYKVTTRPDSQRDFYKSLSSARVIVEQTFGMLKGRWWRLLDKLDESVDTVPSTVISCCIITTYAKRSMMALKLMSAI